MRVGYILFDAAGRSGDSPLKDVRVRRIAHAIDRPQFTKSFFGTEARPAAPCFYTQFGCFQDAQIRVRPRQSEAALAEAGYPNGFDTELYAYREEMGRCSRRLYAHDRCAPRSTSCNIPPSATRIKLA
jgi:peptide/nickel transport system substrate-binding protein